MRPGTSHDSMNDNKLQNGKIVECFLVFNQLTRLSPSKHHIDGGKMTNETAHSQAASVQIQSETRISFLSWQSYRWRKKLKWWGGAAKSLTVHFWEMMDLLVTVMLSWWFPTEAKKQAQPGFVFPLFSTRTRCTYACCCWLDLLSTMVYNREDFMNEGLRKLVLSYWTRCSYG